MIPIIINKRAGSLRSSPSLGQNARIKSWLDGHGQVERVHGKRIQERLSRLRDAGYKRVAVGGGDGTLSSAARVLAETDVELVPLPLGTLNHFCRDLGVPLEPDGWDALLASSNVRSVDLGQVNGMTFLNNFSIGVYPTIASLREEFVDERLLGSKRLATFWAATRARMRTKPLELTLTFTHGGEVESGSHTCEALIVANNAYGFGADTLVGRENLRQGRLVIYLVRELAKIGMADVVTALLQQEPTLDGIEGLEVLECETLSITMRNKRKVLAAIDGELERLYTPVVATSQPQKLNVVV